MDIELQRTDGVCYMLYGIALSVGIVIHRIYAPLVPRPVMMRMLDSVHQRVTEHHVRMRHVYLGTKDLLPVGIFAVTHLAEKTKILLHAAVTVGAFDTRLVHGAATGRNLLLTLVIDISQASLYHIFRPLVQLVEVIRSIEFLLPLEAKPFDIFLYGIHIFGILFSRIRVVITEVSLSAIFLGQSEIDAQTLRVSKVQISVRLGRKTGKNAVHLTAFEVIFDNLLQEIQFFCRFFHIK